MSFSKMKKNRSAAIEQLVATAQEQTSKKSYKDDRFWQPTIDKSGNGFAVIRFLPAPDGEATPWVSYWDHGFQGPTGKWYIEKSLTTIGQEDPVAQRNSELWNSGIDADRETARAQKRRLHYVANIYVVSDPGNPENNGKVFLYKFGKKIFDKINDVMVPEFQDEAPINPFDFWEGANFKLKIRKVEGFRNYDKSEFDSPSALLDGDDDKLEALYNSQYSLADINDPSTFKPYDELKAKMESVLCLATAAREQTNMSNDVAEAAEMPVAEAPSALQVTEETKDDSAENAESALDYFKNLAAQS